MRPSLALGRTATAALVAGALTAATALGAWYSAQLGAARLRPRPVAFLSLRAHVVLQPLQAGPLWQDGFREGRGPLLRRYLLGGSAPADQRFLQLSRGELGVGVTGQRHGFEGFFAVTRAAFPARSVIVARLHYAPLALKPGTVAESLVAVQTATTLFTGAINYVLVSITQSGSRRVLQIGYANGKIRNARTYILAALPLTGPAWARPRWLTLSLETDGAHHLEVWLAGARRWSFDTAQSMNVEPPFQIYLEVQSRGVRHVARFSALAVYGSSRLTFEGLPAGASVTVSGPNGQATATAGRDGIAAVPLRPPRLAFTGTVAVEVQGRRHLFRAIPLAAGSVYRLRVRAGSPRG